MFVEDAAILGGKPVNSRATALYQAICKPGYPYSIHGDVVVVPAGGLAGARNNSPALLDGRLHLGHDALRPRGEHVHAAGAIVSRAATCRGVPRVGSGVYRHSFHTGAVIWLARNWPPLLSSYSQPIANWNRPGRVSRFDARLCGYADADRFRVLERRSSTPGTHADGIRVRHTGAAGNWGTTVAGAGLTKLTWAIGLSASAFRSLARIFRLRRKRQYRYLGRRTRHNTGA